MLKAFQRIFVADVFDRFDPTHEMAVMIAMRIVKTQHSSVVTLMDLVVDIRQVISSHLNSAWRHYPPNLEGQNAAALFGLDLVALIFEKRVWLFSHRCAPFTRSRCVS